MSTRYVWERHEIKENYKIEKTETKQYTYNVPSGNTACISGDYYEIQDGKFRVYSSLDPLTPGHQTPINGSTDSPRMYALPTPSGYDEPYDVMLSRQNGYRFTLGYVGFEPRKRIIYSNIKDDDTHQTFYINRAVFESQEAGNFIRNVSSGYSDTYSNNGINGSYWYIYKGSDSIDPYSVNYSNDSSNPGDSITIRASTRTPTYGGTVNYQFSYSIDGGSSWTNIGSKSTTPSVIVTIPTNAEKFMGRVVASDTWGFTSTSYIRGENLSLVNLLAYVGVNGKARSALKIYVGVNGKAREVKAGYVGVNGKARKFM